MNSRVGALTIENVAPLCKNTPRLRQLLQVREGFENANLPIEQDSKFDTADPVGTMHRVHEFLGLPKSDEIIERRKKRPYQPMDPATRRRLEECFEPHNQELYEYLGVDFGW
jgi:hypothetical protein